MSQPSTSQAPARVKGKKYCAAANCEGTEHLFAWPQGANSSTEQRRLWTAFVKRKVTNFIERPSSRLCFRHFKEEDFANYQEYVRRAPEKIRYDKIIEMSMHILQPH